MSSTRKRRLVVIAAMCVLLALIVPFVAMAKVKITFTSWRSSGAGKELEEEIVRRFNATHPDIEATFVPGPWSQALLEQLIVQVAGGAAPDVGTLRGVTVGPILESLSVDLTPYIQRDRYPLNRFMPVTLTLAQRDGRIYGLPFALGSLVIFCNKDLFAQAGLSLPRKGWTIDDFRGNALRLTVDKQGDGTIDQWGLDHIDPGKLYLWGQLFGGRFLSGTGTTTAITEPAFTAALQWAQDLILRDQVVRGSGNEWATGVSAMGFEFESSIGVYIDAKVDQKFSWGTTYMPAAPGTGTLTYIQWHVMAALSGTRHPEAAWEFIKFYNSDEMQRYAGERGWEPATPIGRRALGLNGPVPVGSTREEVYTPIIDPPEMLTVPWEVTGMSDIWPDLTSMFGRVLKGEENPRSAVDRLAPVINTKLAQLQQKTH